MTSETVVVELQKLLREEEADRDSHRLNSSKGGRSASYETGRADGHQAAIVRLRKVLASDSQGGEATRLACHRRLPEINDRHCGKPAEYIVWGKLFPPDALGPRCWDCANDQLSSGWWHRIDQSAIYVLPAPTQPSLSATFRKRLNEIAAVIEDNDDSRFCQTDAGLLRHLASAPPEGSGDDRIAQLEARLEDARAEIRGLEEAHDRAEARMANAKRKLFTDPVLRAAGDAHVRTEIRGGKMPAALRAAAALAFEETQDPPPTEPPEGTVEARRSVSRVVEAARTLAAVYCREYAEEDEQGTGTQTRLAVLVEAVDALEGHRPCKCGRPSRHVGSACPKYAIPPSPPEPQALEGEGKRRTIYECPDPDCDTWASYPEHTDNQGPLSLDERCGYAGHGRPVAVEFMPVSKHDATVERLAAENAEFRRQASSYAVIGVVTENAELRTRANDLQARLEKAGQETDRLKDKLATRLEVGTTLYDAVTTLLSQVGQAEAALDELAAEFERRAVVAFAAYAPQRQQANEEAAQLLREKQAVLKGGGADGE